MTVTNPIVANALVANTGRAVCNFFGTLPGNWPGLKSLLWRGCAHSKRETRTGVTDR